MAADKSAVEGGDGEVFQLVAASKVWMAHWGSNEAAWREMILSMENVAFS